jgi:hypothetical protein
MLLTFFSFIQVKGVLDPCDDNNAKRGWDEMKVDSDFDIDGDFSDTQVNIKQSIPISYSAIALICNLMCYYHKYQYLNLYNMVFFLSEMF